MQNNQDIVEFEPMFTKLWRFLKWMPGAFFKEFNESDGDTQFLMFIVFILGIFFVVTLGILIWAMSLWPLIFIGGVIGLFDLFRFIGYVQVRMSSDGE